ncbi:MAG: ABC transporter substrate-binding protein, partial [Oscillospiraceae bacterium]
LMAGFLAASTALSLAACSTSTTSTSTGDSGAANNSTDSSAADNNSTDNSTAGDSTASGDKLTLTVLTHRTDRKDDGTLAEMTKSFEEANNCTVVYQAFTDYSTDVPTMMNTTEYGDVLMIPDTVKLEDLSNFFEPLGTYDEMNEKYMWADKKMYDNTVYGIAHLGTIAGGICYNKRIWKEAGITELPKTPEDFIEDLKAIAATTDAIPYYTNFANADWTLVQWASLVNSASGSKSYETDILTSQRDLFVPGDAYYEVYKLMFDIFKDPTLHEEDPATSDWEGCKKAINDGKIATMVMGSWAVSQFKEAGENPDDIGYMPAPFSVNGKQYAESTADYCLGINKNRSDEIKELGKKYITWFVEESGFAQKEGSVCALRGSEMPDYLTDFADCEFFVTDTAPDGLVGVWDAINNDSEVGTWQGDAANFKIQIAEAAFAGEGEDKFESILADANAKWNATRDANEDLKAYLAAN